MTDKEQIMIDGVNVSKCEFILDSIGIICNLKNGRTDKCNCSDYPDCYFKQLARKTQECEELISEKDFYLQKIETLENKCEELESQIEIYSNTLEGVSQKILKSEQECEKYKKVLDEVLSIVTNSDMLPCADFDVDCTKCKDRITEKGKRCMRYGLIKIKNVIEKTKDGK